MFGGSLAGALPLGVLLDRVSPNKLLWLAASLSAVGAFAAALSVTAEHMLLFGVSVTVSGFGIVLFVLVSLSTVAKLVEPNQLANANAKLDLARTSVAFLVPLILGLSLNAHTAGATLLVSCLISLYAIATVRRLPKLPRLKPTNGVSTLSLKNGFKLVTSEPLLRAVTLCAVSWNAAFAGLIVVSIPIFDSLYALDAPFLGTAMAVFGVGSVAGAWTMQHHAHRVPPGVVLVFGPACSLLTVTALLTGPTLGAAAVLFAFFLLGYGPTMWLSAQHAIRQAVSPPHLLGRVNAVIHTAMYGVRPLGAIGCGWMADTAGVVPSLILVIAGFAGSLLTAAVGPMRHVRHYDGLSGSTRATR